MERSQLFRFGVEVQKKPRPIRLRFRAGSARVSAFVLAGQWLEAGAGGGKSGDLFLRVRLARHPDFTVEGSDLVHEVKIEPWQAVLGAEITVPTLEGSVRMKIPSGTQGGQRFRLRGRGLSSSTGTRGDLFVATQIQIPKKVTEAERKVGQTWQSYMACSHGARSPCKGALTERGDGKALSRQLNGQH